MSNTGDHNALLLQVMAHDLLAPLTATKWQTELLTKAIKDKTKREQYLSGIAESTELGIALTKHAHVAAKVLSHAYQGDLIKAHISDSIRDSVEELKLQYQRHGLELDFSIEDEKDMRDVDIELTRLYIWAIAKFFLSCTPPQTKVSMQGYRTENPEEPKYIFIATAEKIPNADEYVQSFNSEEAHGNLDQLYVFVKLIHEITPLLKASIFAEEQSGNLTLQAKL